MKIKGSFTVLLDLAVHLRLQVDATTNDELYRSIFRYTSEPLSPIAVKYIYYIEQAELRTGRILMDGSKISRGALVENNWYRASSKM